MKKMTKKLNNGSSANSLFEQLNRILIIEDEEFLVPALRSDLEMEGCAIDVSGSGDEAIRHIRDNRPDLILLDLLMTKQDGFYVVQKLKKNPDWMPIPVIVSSPLGSNSEIKRALEMGADDYYVKSPYVIDEVIEKMKLYLEGTRTV